MSTSHYTYEIRKPIQTTTKLVNRWDRDVKHYKTYQAIVNGCGYFYSQKNEQLYDFNQDLVNIFLEEVIGEWNYFFSFRINDILESFGTQYSKEILINCRNINEELSAVINAENFKIIKLSLEKQVIEIVSCNLKSFRKEARAVIESSRQQMSRIASPLIEKCMFRGYEKCQMESGANMFQRMKSIMRDYISENKKAMYDDVADQIMTKFEKLQTDLMNQATKMHKVIFQEIRSIYANLISEKRTDKQINTLHQIESMCEEILQIHNDVGIYGTPVTEHLRELNGRRSRPNIAIKRENPDSQQIQPPAKKTK